MGLLLLLGLAFDLPLVTGNAFLLPSGVEELLLPHMVYVLHLLVRQDGGSHCPLTSCMRALLRWASSVLQSHP